MDFEWDDAKRLSNVVKHGIDFCDAEILFHGAHLAAAGSTVGGEVRLLAVGLIGDLHVTAIFTMRGEVRRIISMRRARDVERQRYQEVFDCGPHPPAWC